VKASRDELQSKFEPVALHQLQSDADSLRFLQSFNRVSRIDERWFVHETTGAMSPLHCALVWRVFARQREVLVGCFARPDDYRISEEANAGMCNVVC
jgi:hypothetical protein